MRQGKKKRKRRKLCENSFLDAADSGYPRLATLDHILEKKIWKFTNLLLQPQLYFDLAAYPEVPRSYKTVVWVRYPGHCNLMLIMRKIRQVRNRIDVMLQLWQGNAEDDDGCY